jgi:DNA-binding winged helix-turn-helix (wHTH) protein
VVAFPPYRLDLDEERLWKGTKLLALRRKPFAILRYLVANPRRLVTQEELLEHVWSGSTVSESAIRTQLHELRQVLGEGVIETVIGRGYRFTAELVDDGANVVSPVATAPVAQAAIVGRSTQLETLDAALERALGGHRTLCFVTGEPGIGKTTLVDSFVDSHPEIVAVRGHCIEQQSTPEAYLAVIELFGKLRQSVHGERVLAALVRYAPTFLAQMPHMIPEAQLEEVTRKARAGTEARMVRELIEALETVCMQHPLVLVLEDLHWSDVATIDLLNVLGQRRERAKLMVIATARRAEVQAVTHPLNRVMRGLTARNGATTIVLDRVGVDDIARLLDARFPGHAFPAAFVEVVTRITAGTPLFVVSLLDDLLAREMIAEEAEQWRLTVPLDEVAAFRPESVTQLIDIQLDRLAADEQQVLEAASVIGSEIPTALVAAALEISVERADEICDGLARRALFLHRKGSEEWPDGTLQTRYAFTHDLVHVVCVERTALARKQRWHRSIASRLEAAYAERCDPGSGEQTGEVAHVLATHHDKGQSPGATRWYIAAARRTAQRFARLDALKLFDRALELLPRVPESRERDELELQILNGRGPLAIRTGDGISSVPIALFERAVTLARRIDDPPRLFAALVDLDVRSAMLTNYTRAAEISDQLDELSRTFTPDAGMIAAMLGAQALESMYRGQLARAMELQERLLTDQKFAGMSTSGRGDDATRARMPDAGSRDMSAEIAYFAIVQWLCGDGDRALTVTRAAAERIRVLGDPFMRGLSIVGLCRVHFARGDAPEEIFAAARNMPDAGASAWHVHEVEVFSAWATSFRVPVANELAEKLVAEFRQRVAKFPLGATIVALPLIDALRRSGHAAHASAITEEMLTFARDRGERIFQPELVRLRGQLCESTDPASAAGSYLEAIALAHEMGARSLELRAAIDLVSVGHADATARLATAIAAFPESIETPELAAGRRLLSVQ